MAVTPVAAIADAISAGFKLLKTMQDSRHVRRLRAAVDNGEKYIMESEKDVPEKKLLAKYRKLFFKYNQG